MEPSITINGHTLSDAQAMSVRVAVTSFRADLDQPSAADALGPIAAAYAARLDEVLASMFRTQS